MNKKYLTFIIILLQILFLSSMIWFHVAKLRNSTRILLKTVPYDPKSIFRGRYVDLRYEISSLDAALLKDASPGKLKGREALFVTLKKEAEYWQADAIYRNKPKDPAKLFIRGRLSYYNSYQNKINLEYGIESFFLNEKAADEVELGTRRRFDWQEEDRRRQELIGQLDAETQRIKKAGITKWWLESLDKELEIWLKEGIVNQETKEVIHNKYATALEKLAAVEDSLRPQAPSGQKPIIVEIAVDRDGSGYPTKLLFEGKEYR